MRMRSAIAGATAALALLAVPAAAGTAPTRVSATGDEISETEMSLLLSRAKVKPGPAIIEFRNSGEDDHDMRLKRAGFEGEWGTGVLHSGDIDTVELRLRRDSRYRLWCSLQEGLHRELGMEATLRVRRKR
jgi:plastocyanin